MSCSAPPAGSWTRSASRSPSAARWSGSTGRPRGHAPAADAAGGAARGRPGAAIPAVRRAHGGAHLGHARPRRLVRAAGHPVGFEPEAVRRRGRASGLDRHRRRLAVRPSAQRHLVRGPPSAAAGPGPAARGVPDRTGGAHRRGGRPHPRPVLLHASGQAGGRGAPRADQPAAALPGRRPHRPAGQAVRRGRADLPVRHAVAVAGRGRAGELAAARRHRPDPVPAARRPARLGPAARGGRPRRQRVHDGRGVAGRAAAGPGRRPAAADDDRPRRGGGPRSPAGDRPLRRFPPRVAAPVLDHHRPCPRPCRPAPPGRRFATVNPLRAG